MAVTNVMLPMIRKVMPGLIAQQITGVQAMSAPTGSIFAVKNDWASREYNKKYWPHQFIVEFKQRKEIERWCWEHFNGRHWQSSSNKFVFKKSADAAMFKLRWECKQV